jgi:hypothetical protein
MSCCGQKRDSIAADARSRNVVTQPHVQPRVAPVRPGPAAPAVSPAPDRNLTVTLRYRGQSTLSDRGAQTGNRYQFSRGRTMHAVDRRDVEALVATGLFERVWG